MIFTGTNLTIKRNFYTQTGNLAFGLNCTVDNTTGTYHFGVSGAQGTQDFKLQSGKLYQGSRFLHSYQSETTFSLAVQFSSGSTSVVKDGKMLSCGLPKTTGNYDYFYFSRENAGMAADFDVLISGDDLPAYAIQSQGYLLYSGQNAVTGRFSNNSNYPIKIFNSTMLATQNYAFGKLVGDINGLNSGVFSYSGDYSVIDITDPILTTFNTNFGDTQQIFQITDARTLSRFVYLTGPTDYSFNTTGVLNRDLTYINYSGGFGGANFPTAINFSLEYVSGSGLKNGLASYSILEIGNFAKSGLLTGLLSSLTGNIYASEFSWATGVATGFFSGLGTGMASGLGYTGLVGGQFTGQYTGTIYPGSGTLSANGQKVGIGIGGSGTYYTSAAYATGYIDLAGMGVGDYFLIDSATGDFVYMVAQKDVSQTCSTNTSPLVNIFTTLTEMVSCISGAAGWLGLNAVISGSSLVYFTSLAAGTIGNSALLDDDGGFGWPGAGYLTGGSIGPATTGFVVPIGPYTGYLNTTLTGSGNYSSIATGSALYPYNKTFSGSWDFLTGVGQNSLVSMKNSLSNTKMTGAGIFDPNSLVNFQITHNIIDDNNDSVRLVISGAQVLNPITQTLIN